MKIYERRNCLDVVLGENCYCVNNTVANLQLAKVAAFLEDDCLDVVLGENCYCS